MSTIAATYQPIKAMEDEGIRHKPSSSSSSKRSGGIYDIDYTELMKKMGTSHKPEVQYLAGKAFELGLLPGIKVNLKEARKWYEKAATQGHEEASQGLIRVQNKLKVDTPKTLSGFPVQSELQSNSQDSGEIKSLPINEPRTEDVDKPAGLQEVSGGSSADPKKFSWDLSPALMEVD